MAQLDSASVFGTEGWGFKSLRAYLATLTAILDVFLAFGYTCRCVVYTHFYTRRPTPKGNVSMTKYIPQRPHKPCPDFPLFPHQTGYWCKKVRGKLRYFGKVSDDPKGQAALDKWLDQKDDLLAGRVPRVKVEGLTVRDLCNRFLSAKKDLLNASEINPRTFAELHDTCQRIGDAFGWDRPVSDLVADDFDRLRRASAKQWGPHRLGGEVQRTRCIFKYGVDAGLIQQPVRYGPTFKKPSRKVLR